MESVSAMPAMKVAPSANAAPRTDDFSLYYDEALTQPTPYRAGGTYFAKARDRMDRTFELIRPNVAGSTVLDVGASPFYLLYRAQAAGARECHGIYFSNDSHPLRARDRIYSRFGAIGLNHANIEADDLPFPDDSVDILSACEILEHCEHFPVRFAREIRRVLRPGGLLCVTVPNVASIANILKLLFQRNVYMKYRSDSTGRHKHEYTLTQLRDFIAYLGVDILKVGYLPSPTSDKFWLRPAYRAIARIPGIRRYSPVIYIVGRMPDTKSAGELGRAPASLYDDALSIED